MNTANAAIGSAVDTRSYFRFLTKEAIVSYGICNGILNGLIYFFMHRGEDFAAVNAATYLIDFLLTAFILGVILVPIVFAMTKSKMKKGQTPQIPYDKAHHGIFRLVSNNKVVVTLVITMLVTALVPAICVGFADGLGILPHSLMGGAVLKSVMCGATGALAGKLAVEATLLGMV